MILLESLEVDGFKCLKKIALAFPTDGTILIKGDNGAGKSSLFEAVYFALYGKPLVYENKYEDTIRYDSQQAMVRLRFTVDGTSLTVTRKLRRGKPTEATLEIRYPGGEVERIRGVRAVDKRIVQEMGGLTGDALLNSCFVEQKKLEKLESQERAERRRSLLTLLNLKRLEELGRAFKVETRDERNLELARGKLALARLREELPRAKERLQQVERRLTAIAVLKLLDRLDKLKRRMEEEKARLEQLGSQRDELQKRLEEIERLKGALNALETIAECERNIQHEEKEIERLESELEEISRLEELLPQRQEELEELRSLATQLQELEGRREKEKELQRQVERAEDVLRQARTLEEQIRRCTEELEAKKASLDAKKKEYALIKEMALLREWLKAKKVAEQYTHFDTAVAEREQEIRKRREEKGELEARRRRHLGGIIAAVVLLITSMTTTAVLAGIRRTSLLPFTLALFALGLALAGALYPRMRSLNRLISRLDDEIHRLEREVEGIRSRKQGLIEAGGPYTSLEECEEGLRREGVAIPASLEAGHRRLAELEAILREPVEEKVAYGEIQSLRTAIERLEEERVKYERELETLNAPSISDELERLRRELEEMAVHIGEGEARLLPRLREKGLPANPARLNVLIGGLERDIANMRRQVDKRAALKVSRRSRLEEVRRLKEIISQKSEAYVRAFSEPVPEAAEREEACERITARLEELDEEGTKARLDEVQRGIGEAKRGVADCQQAIEEGEGELAARLAEMGLGIEGEVTLEAYQRTEPLFVDVSLEEEEGLRGERDELLGRVRHLCEDARRLEEEYHLVDVELDLKECEAEVARLAREIEVKRRVTKIVKMARESILEKVLPNTEQNMALILPALTDGKYKDAHIDEDYKIGIWDEEAMRYVAKKVFSGGERDQFSLALRLAFAIATLPQELGTSPGFIFLDEPLSSFDRERREGFLSLLTRGLIRTHFRQIFLISHQALTDELFDYHIELDDGQIVSSDLGG